MAQVEIATKKADGVEVFYRSAGSPSAPVVLLLHGFPASSFMFRNLIPLLAPHYRVIAPDLPGFGFTTVGAERNYEYSFTSLTRTVEAFLDALEITRFAVYIFDYGAPTALRLALARPHAITAIVTQNGNAYEEGFGAEFWAPIRAYWASNSQADRERIRAAALTLDLTRWQYTAGSVHPHRIPPETWHLDYALMERPGNKDVQLDLLRDYKTNVPLYPRFQEYLRSSHVPILAVWGKHDSIFVSAGAEALKRDVASVELHYFEAGHFALETNEPEMARLMLHFLEQHHV